MIFRAVFWVGLVSLLMPHSPDLGLGEPGAKAAPSPAALLSAIGLNGVTNLFHRDGDASFAARLADVKAQIEAAQRARLHPNTL